MTGEAVENGACHLALAVAEPTDVLSVIGSRLSLAGDGGRQVRRTWLDTFDRRLYRAGLILEQASARGYTELRLRARDGSQIHADAKGSGQRWPGPVGTLPPGPLRDRLESLAGGRALVPIARATGRIDEHRVVDGDAKTIARIAIERLSVTYPAPGQPLTRLSLTPLRGYQRPAARIAERMAALPGVSVADGPLDMALAAAGLAPDWPGAARPELNPEMPATRALAAILRALLDTIEANVPGTVRDTDPEFLHDLRVAVRRTRSALKLAGDVLPAGTASRFAPEFGWLGDLTTPARDLDVYLLGYPAMTASLLAAVPADLAPLYRHLTGQRAQARERLARGLRSARFRRLTGQWRAALDVADRSRRRSPAVAVFAADRVARANSRVLKAGRSLSASSPAEHMHTLRKRAKELRYMIEMFEPLHERARHVRAVRELKALQDCLGEFQDACVQLAELRAFAEQMSVGRSAPTATLLAMGELAAGMARRRNAARGEFDERWQRFSGPRSQARIAALTDRLSATDRVPGRRAG